MFGLSATSSASPSLQLSLNQFKLQQARQEAQQAQEQVRALEEETNNARRVADRVQGNVSTLEVESRQEQTTLNTQGQITGRILNTTA